MSADLVSVIVPSYNHSRYIRDALLSVSEQDYRPLEVIVVDDGSKDNSADVLRDWQKQGSTGAPLERVAVLTRETNIGAHATLNEAVGMSSGRIVMPLNSDDRYRPNRVSRIVAAMGADELAFAFSRVNYFNEDDPHGRPTPSAVRYEAEVQWILDNLPSISYGLLHQQWAVSTGNFAFTRAVYDRLGGFADLAYCHDWDFILRACLYCEPVFVDDVLYDYRLHGDNSFASLGHVAGRESAAVIARYWNASLGDVPNVLAPIPKNWPGAFEALLPLLATDDLVNAARETLPRFITRRKPRPR